MSKKFATIYRIGHREKYKDKQRNVSIRD